MSMIYEACATGQQTTNGEDLFDPAEALDRVCEDYELLEELLQLFVPHRDRLLQELGDAIELHLPERVDEAAHALKGSIATFSTKRPYLIARELEYCGKECRLDTAPQLLAALRATLTELEAAVQQLISTRG
jgi:HPt (histidine-containing phosphotransfer) domain-containing protein